MAPDLGVPWWLASTQERLTDLASDCDCGGGGGLCLSRTQILRTDSQEVTV